MKIIIEDQGRTILEIGEGQLVAMAPGTRREHADCLDSLSDALKVMAATMQAPVSSRANVKAN